MKQRTITIYADGGARGNPGPAGAGAVVYAPNGEVAATVSMFLGITTNNWAEYEALIQGLAGAQALFGNPILEHVAVKLDSELVVRQMKGEYRVKHPELKKQYARVQKLLAGFPHISFTHVRREHNAIADRLANDAMDRGA